MEKYAKKFQDFINTKGWSLLTSYKGRFKKIKIKCENEHVWNSTPASVYQGSRCSICVSKNHPNTIRKDSAKNEFFGILKGLRYNIISNYENNNKRVRIRCQNQHEFSMGPKYFKRLVKQNIIPCKKCRKSNSDRIK